jgi:ankyrin repeat protein
MPDLPSRPDLAQLRRRAKDLLRDARGGDAAASARIRAVSDAVTLAAAQLALAREHGFSSWPRLKIEVERRQILDDRDVGRLAALLADEPELATASMEHWCDHPRGASPLGYVAMLRYDTVGDLWRDLSGTDAVAAALIAAGAPVDGDPGEPETPLITAASYGDAAVARVLIEAGADVEATASPDAGGVPGGSALLHAAVFGMTDVVDVLVEAGASVESIEVAAAAGDLAGWLETDAAADARIRALVMASDHQRLDVIERLVTSGVPVDGVDPVWGGHPLRTAASNGRPESARRLLALGADPDLADEEGRRPLDLVRSRRPAVGGEAFDEVEAILAPVTSRARRATTSRRRTAETSGTTGPTVTVEIAGSDLPGRSCGPGPSGEMYGNVHVVLKRRKDGVVELVPGDAPSATWRFPMTVRRDEDGTLDYGGPFVLGRRGERSLGLVWGELGRDDGFAVFRAATLRLEDLDPDLVRQALDTGRGLACSLGLTDEQGHPRCASVRPPLVAWTVAPGGG